MMNPLEGADILSARRDERDTARLDWEVISSLIERMRGENWAFGRNDSEAFFAFLDVAYCIREARLADLIEIRIFLPFRR